MGAFGVDSWGGAGFATHIEALHLTPKGKTPNAPDAISLEFLTAAGNPLRGFVQCPYADLELERRL